MRGAELSPSAEQAQHILCADLTLCEGNSVPLGHALTQEEVEHIKCNAAFLTYCLRNAYFAYTCILWRRARIARNPLGGTFQPRGDFLRSERFRLIMSGLQAKKSSGKCRFAKRRWQNGLLFRQNWLVSTVNIRRRKIKQGVPRCSTRRASFENDPCFVGKFGAFRGLSRCFGM